MTSAQLFGVIATGLLSLIGVVFVSWMTARSHSATLGQTVTDRALHQQNVQLDRQERQIARLEAAVEHERAEKEKLARRVEELERKLREAGME